MSSGEVVGPPAARASPSGQHQHRSHHSRDGSNNNNNNINITNNTTKSSSHGHRRGGRPPMIIRHGSMATTYARTEDEQFAAEHGMERPEQTIGQLGSLSLISNNIVGPGMMNLPHLFRLAGILPASAMIAFLCVCSSLCGTFLSQTIAAIPGNKNFGMGIDFSTAFNLLLGDHWYAVAETLFILSCMVQSCSAIVQMSQCLDALMSSFFFKRTFALQVLPSLELLEWTGETCDKGAIEAGLVSTVEACTPFYDDGPMVISLGFLLVTIFYLPLGMGHIKETMWVQLLSFAAMFILVGIFVNEFITNTGGLDHPLPWVGTDFSKLGGVVLFNFAYSTTVPAWLQEKKTEVSVNQTIWTSTSLATVVYILFGVTAAMSFDDPGENMLTLLASPRVRPITRFAAAIFGLSIVGSGAPVFCVMMKNALYSGRVLSAQNSFLVGSILPYCISWMMYKGSVMLTVVSWAGLIVNGTVAFLLPCVLVILSHYYMRLYGGGGSSSNSSSASKPGAPSEERGDNGVVYRGLSAQALHELNDLVEKSPNPDRRVITEWTSHHMLVEPPPRHDRPELGALLDVPVDVPMPDDNGSGRGGDFGDGKEIDGPQKESSNVTSSTSSGGSYSRLSKTTPTATNGSAPGLTTGATVATETTASAAAAAVTTALSGAGGGMGNGSPHSSGQASEEFDGDGNDDDDTSSSSSASSSGGGLDDDEDEEKDGEVTGAGEGDEETGLLTQQAATSYGSTAQDGGNITGLGLEQRRPSQAAARHRRTAGRSASRNATKALPPLLRPYIEHISVIVGVSFLTILLFTIGVDIKTGTV